MTIQNYTISFIEDGEKKEEIFCSKQYTVQRYLELLASKHDISNLTVGMWTGVRKWVWTDITGKINDFLRK